MKTTFLACPKCSRKLIQSNDILVCGICQKQWEIRGGIPRFIPDPYYWGEVPLSIMQNVNQTSQQGHWQQAVKNIIGDQYPEIYHYITDNSRIDFSYYLQLGKESVALDIGSGWGTISCLLAGQCGTVISVESVTERIEFLKIRAEQEGLHNINTLQASFLELPILPETLDLAVLNGVLEWVGIASDNGSPEELQLQVLRKLHQSIKPGGCLYVGIENRFGYGYFLGGKDHSDLPYTSLVPRWVADQMMHFKGQTSRRTTQAAGKYRTYTYSYWGYRSLLMKAGFSEVNIYSVFPDYNHPAYIIPNENYHAFRYLIQHLYSGNSVKKKLLRNVAGFLSIIGAQKLFSPCFSIYAFK